MEEDKLKPEIIESADGSHTLRVESLNENYHSHKGALTESLHVFLKMGLALFSEKESIQLLEVGFGTGLNAMLTALDKDRKHVNYTSLETYPLSWEMVSKLNYAKLSNDSKAERVFEKMHTTPWGEFAEITEGFSLRKVKSGLQVFQSDIHFDLVYYDAFAPHAQPELWEPVIWQKLFEMMIVGGVLVTYCAKGQVRRDMQAAGFKVERLEGPPGKREMIRATKP
jgi:tRNA U34 5-methylaminomethyl-2-thiouridine-forming methyltransferase MnmC